MGVYRCCIRLSWSNYDAAIDAQNAAGVWDVNYAGVWHLEEQVTDEQTSGTHDDSTGVHDGSMCRVDTVPAENVSQASMNADHVLIAQGRPHTSDAMAPAIQGVPDHPVR